MEHFYMRWNLHIKTVGIGVNQFASTIYSYQTI
jgi:hypothetical protein